MRDMAELERIKRETIAGNNLSPERKGARIVVGMASCGIAAGAKAVYDALLERAREAKVTGASVVKTGCIGMCRLEPIVEVTLPGQEKMTYVKVTAEMAPRIIAEHVIGGEPVAEYTIGAAEA